ncbi:HAD-IA family hydrolase [Aestuariimicrobium soli]|uniref:HAD-IA family hydrolase n=1 Tax=Aestuariimicrobium soli TaxID=2035834 RepID=UPI003EBB01CF
MIVFDLGGVLADHDGKEGATAALLGVEVAQLAEPYWRHRQLYDEGAGNLDYWGRIGADLGIDVTPELADRLGVADSDGWAAIRPTARQVLADLYGAGVPTAILSNAPVDMYEAIDHAEWRALVGPVFVSGVLGVAKPDLEIYRHVAETLDLEPGRLSFIDDKLINVHGAIASGWRAHQWVSDADTRTWLETIGALPTP